MTQETQVNIHPGMARLRALYPVERPPVISLPASLAEPSLKLADSFVYFITDGTAIKIGYSYDPLRRLNALQTGHHAELLFLGAVSGIPEAEIHTRFDHLRLRGEWFRPAPEIAQFILKHRDHRLVKERVRRVRRDLVALAKTAVARDVQSQILEFAVRLEKIENDPADAELERLASER